MLKILIRVLVMAAALLLITQLGIGVTVDSLYIALVVAIIWGVLGLTVRPLIMLLTLPLNIITLGLFSVVINALLFWLLSTFIAGFHVSGFVAAVLGVVILSVVSWILHAIL